MKCYNERPGMIGGQLIWMIEHTKVLQYRPVTGFGEWVTVPEPEEILPLDDGVSK